MAETILAFIGGSVLVIAIGTALSSHMLRWLAAHCLLQAGALESYQEYRRDHLNRQMVACGVAVPVVDAQPEELKP